MGAGATVLLPGRAAGRHAKEPGPDAVGLLYDPVRCIGCEECIRACADENGGDAEAATAAGATLSPVALTVLERHEVGWRKSFLKVQCMHCVDPGCVSACMLGAMSKGPDGAVTWDGDLCVGCRYCEIACPFVVPRFEWDTPTPKLTKCQLCPERRAEGKLPACADRCRMGALVYGRRSDLLAEAHARMAAHPEQYNGRVYGEREGGGTSVLYLGKAGISFADMGLPELGPQSVPALPETIQHTVYKGFVAPLALLGVLGAVVRRNVRRARAAEAALPAHEHEHAEPVGGKLLTWPVAVLAALAVVGFAAVAWRFLVGLGPTTNMSDGYPFGLWITFDVVTGTALACGGYAMALLVYVLNRGRYHPLVRPAIVTSALGYTLGGLSVLIDLGRAWNFWKIPTYAAAWNFNSILLEVALCIMLYTTVLWIEVSPAVLEGWRESRLTPLRRLAIAVLPWMERALPYAIALGVLLPTMHQSSLGSLMLLAGRKVDPLWQTPLLPLLFLISCVGMGYGAVTLESCLSAKAFRRPVETPILRALAVPVAVVLLTYSTLRLIDVTVRDQLGRVLSLEGFAPLFLLEMALFVVPALALLAWRRRGGFAFFTTVGALVILAGGLYRFSTFLITFSPGPEWSYFPSAAEFAVTVGLVAAELLGYVVLVKKFPILQAVAEPHRPAASRRRPAAVAAAVLLLLSLGVAPEATAQTARHAPSVQAQSSRQAPSARVQSSRRAPDLRCLTSKQCLDEPVAADEPHGAVCATCHDFSAQRTPADAAKSCAQRGCHDDAAKLTPYHRGLRAEVSRDCIGCHPAHDAARVVTGASCRTCHAGGGLRPGSSTAPAPRTVAPAVAFTHAEHAGVQCTSCHGKGQTHGAVGLHRVEDCRSCHHSPKVATNCNACHGGERRPTIRIEVTRTLDIRLGSLDRPTRSLPFEHERHGALDCRSCHVGEGLAAAAASCTSCHEQHHRPTADCTACHEPPAPGAHDRTVHHGCAGSGCHENVVPALRDAPQTRQVCLACHTERRDHEPGSTCSDCHVLPKPRGRS